MDRVEFFLDDRSLGYSTVAPYTLRWTLAMSDTSAITETHEIHVAAYDTAGNVMESEPVKVDVIPKPPEDEEKDAEGTAILVGAGADLAWRKRQT